MMKKDKNSSKIKFNGNLPSYVFNLEDGEYICRIESFQQADTKFGNQLIIKICTVKEPAPDMVFTVYYRLEGKGVRLSSPLGRLLKELDLIIEKKIQWSNLIGQYVVAEVVTSKNSNVYVKKLTKLPDGIVIEEEGEAEYSEEELEFDEDTEEE